MSRKVQQIKGPTLLISFSMLMIFLISALYVYDTQRTFIFSKATVETQEKGAKHVQS